MKKLISVLFGIITGLCISLYTVSAAVPESLEHLDKSNVDYAEISQLEDSILEELNTIIEIPRKITNEEIDFTKAIKKFSGYGLLESEQINPETLYNQLSANGFVWELPIYVDGTTVLLSINQSGEDFSGDWQVAVISIYENCIVDYCENLLNSLNNANINADSSNFKLCEGLKGIHYPAFIGYDENDEMYIIPAEESTAAVFDFDNNASARDISKGFDVFSYSDVYHALETATDVELQANAIGGIKELNVQPDRKDFYTQPLTVLFVILIGTVITCFIIHIRRGTTYSI